MFGSLMSKVRAVARFVFALAILFTAQAQAQGVVGAWTAQGRDWVWFFQANGQTVLVGTGVKSSCSGVSSKSGTYTASAGSLILIGAPSYGCNGDVLPQTSGTITANYVLSGNTLTLNNMSSNDMGISTLALTPVPAQTASIVGTWRANGTDMVFNFQANGQFVLSGTGVTPNAAPQCIGIGSMHGTYTASAGVFGFSTDSSTCNGVSVPGPGDTAQGGYAFSGNTLAVFAQNTSGSNAGNVHAFILSPQGGATATASGTYSWIPTTGAMTGNWTSSTFACDGPNIGTDTTTGVTITATTMTWPNDNVTWTRSSGTAGDIVGTWTSSDSATGNSYALTFNADGTVSIAGNIVSCSYGGGQNPSAYSQHWSNGYYVQFEYRDSPKSATAVGVTGPGITGSAALTYNAVFGSWNSWTLPSPQVLFGANYPAGLPFSYTFNITDSTGTRTATSTVSCFQVPFVTNVSPSGTVSGTPTFSWTGIADSTAVYGVELNAGNNNQLWHNYNVAGNSIAYSGPALTPGVTYQYNVLVMSSAACRNGASFAQGSFTYGGTTTPVPPVTTVPPTTPLPPPPAVQTVFIAPSGALPPAAVQVNATGTFGNATLRVTLDIVQALQTVPASGFAASTYNVYVIAVVPGAVLGLASPVIAIKARAGWGVLRFPVAPYLENVTQSAVNNQVVIDILANNDISSLVGTEIYIGYGTSDMEMLSAGRYRGVYKAQ
jgi:hypothetical protein